MENYIEYKPSAEVEQWGTEIYNMAIRTAAGSREERWCRQRNAAFLQSKLASMPTIQKLRAEFTINNLLAP